MANPAFVSGLEPPSTGATQSVFGFPENLEPKERTALPLQIDPLNQLIGGKVLIVYSKRIPVRKFASFSYHMEERFNKLPSELSSRKESR